MLSAENYAGDKKSPGLMHKNSNNRMSERRSANIFNKERSSGLNNSKLQSDHSREIDHSIL